MCLMCPIQGMYLPVIFLQSVRSSYDSTPLVYSCCQLPCASLVLRWSVTFMLVTIFGYSEFPFCGVYLFLFSNFVRMFNLLRELYVRPEFQDSAINILLRGDVVVPKCPRSELLLEFTTLRPVRPGWCIYRYGLVIGRISYDSRDRLMGVHYALGRERIVSKLAIPGSY